MPDKTPVTNEADRTMSDDYQALALAEDLYKALGGVGFDKNSITTLALSVEDRVPFNRLNQKVAARLVKVGYAVIGASKERFLEAEARTARDRKDPEVQAVARGPVDGQAVGRGPAPVARDAQPAEEKKAAPTDDDEAEDGAHGETP